MGVIAITRADSPAVPVELSRQVGSPAPARALGEPLLPSALAFRSPTDLTIIFDGLAASGTFPAMVPVAESADSTRDVCEGNSRPTLEHVRMEVETRRISFDRGVADVRVSTFASPDDVAAILSSATATYNDCSAGATNDGQTLSRSANPFVSVSGTTGVNLITTIGEASAPAAMSQTIAVGKGPHLIEVRLLTEGDLNTTDHPDPADLIDAIGDQL